MVLRGGGVWGGGGVVPFKAKRNKKKGGRGEKKCDYSESEQADEKRAERLPWRRGIKGMKVRFKDKCARTPSLAHLHSPFRSTSLLSGQSGQTQGGIPLQSVDRGTFQASPPGHFLLFLGENERDYLSSLSLEAQSKLWWFFRCLSGFKIQMCFLRWARNEHAAPPWPPRPHPPTLCSRPSPRLLAPLLTCLTCLLRFHAGRCNWHVPVQQPLRVRCSSPRVFTSQFVCRVA